MSFFMNGLSFAGEPENKTDGGEERKIRRVKKCVGRENAVCEVQGKTGLVWEKVMSIPPATGQADGGREILEAFGRGRGRQEVMAEKTEIEAKMKERSFRLKGPGGVARAHPSPAPLSRNLRERGDGGNSVPTLGQGRKKSIARDLSM